MAWGIIMIRLLEEAREMLHLVTQAVYFYRKQDYIKGNMYTMGLTRHGGQFFDCAEETGFNEGIELLLPIWKELLEASANGNQTYLADIYAIKLIPALFDIQSCLVSSLDSGPVVYWEDNINAIKDRDSILYNILKDAGENETRNYIFSWAQTGDAVLAVETEQYGQVPLASSVNPWEEAVIYGDGLNSAQAKRCVIIGLGMGYHARYIATSSYFKEIIILESDLEQLRICMMYTDMQGLLSDNRVKIVLCGKAQDYAKWLKEDEDNSTVYKIWYPSVKTIEDRAIRELLENYWVNISSSDNLINVMLDNFENNQKLADKPLDSIKDKFKNKDIIITGAGPSLDNSIEYLDKLQGRDDVIIVCVGKAAKKLISENIVPGFIVVIDAKKGTRWQTGGIENCGVPLIYLSTAAHSLVSEYNGERYIAYQEGIGPSNEYAEKNSLVSYQSGGSVATFAIDMAIRMECKSVICVGLDMGYSGENTHAEGIGKKIQDKRSMRKVKSVDGGTVYTSKTLDIYRRWIERRIENVNKIRFVNTSNGAKIHGMEEKSLKEVAESYCQQIIYCYVEEQGEELNKFVESHNNDSLVYIYYSVIEECEGKLLYCLCDIADKYVNSDKKLWFVTDIKDLYDIVQKLYSALFENIIYINTEESKTFDSGLNISQLVKYFLGIQKSGTGCSYMKQLWNLKDCKKVNDYIKFLCELGTDNIEKEQHITKLWHCLCELLLYEQEQSGLNNNYYNLVIYSILMSISNNAGYTNLYLKEVLFNSNANNRNMYFVWNQFKPRSLKKLVSFDKETRLLCDELYERSYSGFSEELKEYFVKIPLSERNKNLVLIFTIQFLEDMHAPTRTVKERAKALIDSGKDVLIINTAEQYTTDGYMLVYNLFEGEVLEKYNNISQVDIGEYKVPFLQIPDNLPIQYRMQVLAQIINKVKPYYILSVGTGSILADLCGNIVPCASMALAFSTLPKTKNKMKILGRKLSEEERQLYTEEDIIESRFTFELKPQKKKFSRKKAGLPEDKFMLVVVGIRLEFEITKDFMDVLSKACQAGCYVIFAGVMDNYKRLMQDYPFVSENSSFIGYCDDILALMEICDLYINPDRLGGGFSIIEAFAKGKPGVYLNRGDVYTAGGEDFAVGSFDDMLKQILKYKGDKDYYNQMSVIAKKRAELMTSSKEAIADIDHQICQRIEDNYW